MFAISGMIVVLIVRRALLLVILPLAPWHTSRLTTVSLGVIMKGVAALVLLVFLRLRWWLLAIEFSSVEGHWRRQPFLSSVPGLRVELFPMNRPGLGRGFCVRLRWCRWTRWYRGILRFVGSRLLLLDCTAVSELHTTCTTYVIA